MQVSFHNVLALSARASHVGSTHWVNVVLTQTEGTTYLPPEVVLFFEEAKDADAYAAAISAVTIEPKLPTFTCEKCDGPTANAEDDYGEHVCDECLHCGKDMSYDSGD